MATDKDPGELDRCDVDGEGFRALSDCRIQYMAQSVLTPMPWGTHDPGRVGPILPVEQALDVLLWNERHQIRALNMPPGVVLRCWISAEELRHLYPTPTPEHPNGR